MTAQCGYCRLSRLILAWAVVAATATGAAAQTPVIEYTTSVIRAGNQSSNGGEPQRDHIVGTKVNASGQLYLLGTTDHVPLCDPGVACSIYTNPLDSTLFPDYTPQFCFVSRLEPDGTASFTAYFQGFRDCQAFDVDLNGLIHLALRAPYSFGGFAQLRTITDFGQPGMSLSSLNGGLDRIPGRPTVIKDLQADATGNVYVLYQQLFNADSDLQTHLTKVAPSGQPVGTINVGFGGTTVGNALALGTSGQAYVAGRTSPVLIGPGGRDIAFSTTPNALQPDRPTAGNCTQDAFLVRVDTDDTNVTPFMMTYASFLGGSECDDVEGIVAEPLGTLVLSGRTTSSDFPLGPHAAEAYRATATLTGPDGDGFILKLDLNQPPSDQILAGTFMGLELVGPSLSLARDTIHPLVRMPGGALIVTGRAVPSSTELVMPFFDATSSGSPFARFVRVFSPDLTQLRFSTHLDNVGEVLHSVISGNASQRIFVVDERDITDSIRARRIWLSRISSSEPLVDIDGPDGPFTATSPLGVDVLFTGTARHSEGGVVEVDWSGPFPTVHASIAPPYTAGNTTALVTLPVGTHQITLSGHVFGPGGGSSSATRTVVVVSADAPPTLTVPGNIVVSTGNATGTTVTYTATAVDAVDGLLPPSCSPSSGSTFPLGTTTVTCIVSDTAGNTASGSFTVTVNLECAADVTARVSVALSGFVFNPGIGRFSQTIRVTNISPTPIDGPISLVLDNLSSNAVLANANGTTACAAPVGSPLIDLTAANLPPNASRTTVLHFTNPTRLGITYRVRALSGAGPR